MLPEMSTSTKSKEAYLAIILNTVSIKYVHMIINGLAC